MGFFGREPEVSFSSIIFDTSSYRTELTQAWDIGSPWPTVRIWYTPEGDGIGQFYYGIPPNLPRGLQSKMELQEYCLSQNNREVRIVEMDLPEIDEVPCIWSLAKVPQETAGACYIGMLTIPFDRFYFEIKMECAEQETTGMREAELLAQALKMGTVSVGENGQVQGDWNPDSEEYDEMFPNHPLSRLRREFTNIRQSLYIEDAVKKSKPFPLPIR